jgi:hypothetical protein
VRDINHSKLWESDGQAFKTEALTNVATVCEAELPIVMTDITFDVQ